MKCENVLVYDTQEGGTTDNYRAKLTDFSLSVTDLSDTDESGLLKQGLSGTPSYRPPELGQGSRNLEPSQARLVDAWCWGMLLWRVMIDGQGYIDETKNLEREALGIEDIEDLHKDDRLAGVATISVQKHLFTYHASENPGIINLVCSLLRQILVRNTYTSRRAGITEVYNQTYGWFPYLHHGLRSS